MLDEKVAVFKDPIPVDSTMVWNHVTGKPNASAGTPLSKVVQGRPSSDDFCNLVIFQGVCGGFRIRVATEVLDFLACGASFPEPDKPECGKTPGCNMIELSVRNLIQGINRVFILLGQLVQPYKGGFGKHDYIGHPIPVGSECLILLVIEGIVGYDHNWASPVSWEVWLLFFLDHIDCFQE